MIVNLASGKYMFCDTEKANHMSMLKTIRTKTDCRGQDHNPLREMPKYQNKPRGKSG